MVVVEYLYEDMKKLVNLPLEKVVNGLSGLGAPSEYEPETKKIISELTPNRPDWYSMEGLARALKAHYRKEIPEYKTNKSDYQVIVEAKVEKSRPYTACAVVKGLSLNDERITDMVLLQEKLLGTLGRQVKRFGIGIYPLQAISFPVRYTAMKPSEIRYVPLGYEKQMSAKEVLTKHKKGQEYGYLIEKLDEYPVFVDSLGKIMALVPIVNSAETGKVDTATKDVFIEVSGMDFNSCKAALNILVCTFADMGGKVYQVAVKKKGETNLLPDLRPQKMSFDLEKANRTLGVKLNRARAEELLLQMGYRFKGNEVEIPPYRADVLGEIDVIEDLAIAYGYNNFKPTLPDFFHAGRVERRFDHLDETMRGMGFSEIKTFILTNKEKLGRIGYLGNLLEISNPSSEEFSVVRPNLVSDMLDTFAHNKMKGLPQRFYEIGIVRGKEEDEKRLIFGMMGKNLDFSLFRGYLQTLGSEMKMDLLLKKEGIPYLEKEISCVVLSKSRVIGTFGKVEKEVGLRFDIAFDVYICELRI